MNMKVENEMALPTTKSVAVMLLEPYAGKLARTVLRGESSRKGADLLDISKLSSRLICEGYKIVSGYGLGVGSAVISGVLSEIYYNQKKSLTNQLILRPFPQGEDAKKLWETIDKI